ncbi:RNA polymerase sigma factor, sigma-70 family [Selenomonas ruminantium]|uniref:RNA polymerase sigma factor, sigma-70 family n=1 Tax=Selenomonas ruminantium TaxID=971 RepID=A0A1M6RIC4_SELRU|nr:sigma-70 family RNA polymerase sigma factor [Selenomonas ruminantium]SHK32225.1 RNA polymerase sigma factor, sigma-70 family [Selenomonas ruminantium]
MTDFANIYSKYYKRIYNYLYGQFLHREIAEDVAGSVFLAAMENLERCGPAEGKEAPWLFAMARNMAVNYRLRARCRHEVSVWEVPERPGKDSVQEEGTLESPSSLRTCRILEKLTAEEREFLSLRYGLCLTNEEIGRLLGTSPNAVSHKFSRLLAKCRRIDEEK